MNRNAKSIIVNGVNILSLMLGPSIFKILAGWCNVFHQSTENFIIGRLINPIIASTAAGFDPSDFLGNAFETPIYDA